MTTLLQRVYSSAVERLTADQQVPGSNPGAPFFIYQSTSALPGRQWGLLIKCLIRLAVRTPRCGRGNPGSIPGLDILYQNNVKLRIIFRNFIVVRSLKYFSKRQFGRAV